MPAFEIGVRNALILMLSFPLNPLVMLVVDKLVCVGNQNKKMGDVPYSGTEREMFSFTMMSKFLLPSSTSFSAMKAWSAVVLYRSFGVFIWIAYVHSSYSKYSYYSAR